MAKIKTYDSTGRLTSVGRLAQRTQCDFLEGTCGRPVAAVLVGDVTPATQTGRAFCQVHASQGLQMPMGYALAVQVTA